jgi:hypothetical protein
MHFYRKGAHNCSLIHFWLDFANGVDFGVFHVKAGALLGSSGLPFRGFAHLDSVWIAVRLFQF